MSNNLNDSTLISSSSSPNYRVARELGYELSKEQFSELYNYARMVQKEHTNEPELLDRSTNTAIRSNSKSNCNLIKIRNFYAEDFWMKYLRECFENEFKG